MSFTYKDLQDEVKRRATKEEGGTQFDTAVKNVINTSLFRISRDALWRPLRRKATFNTVTTYTTGSGGGTFTSGSKSVTMVGATFLTDDIQPGRRMTLQGSNIDYTIKTITGETTLTVDVNFDGTTISGTGTYSILPQEEYNVPIQASHRMFMWHEQYGYPFMMSYITDQDFYSHGLYNTITSIPEAYRMWGEDWVVEQVKEGSVISVSSSVTTDNNICITIFGTVAGYPDFEEILTDPSDGTTASVGSKSFTSVERVTKASNSTGRITATANSANTTVAVIPVGDTTGGIKYSKCQLYPLPNKVFPMQIQYYKDPYRLVNDNDMHELGGDFDEAIILFCSAKINYETNKDEGNDFMAMFRDEVASLRRNNVDKIDWFPKLRGRRGGGIGKVHVNLLYRQVGPHFGRRA
jgi:hypothetical protein